METNGISYVILAASSTFVMGIVHGMYTGGFRKQAKIPYPNAYATAEEASKNTLAWQFNAAQRAHANYQENQTSVLAAILIAGLKYPLISAGLGAAWTVNRFFFMTGYTNAKKSDGSGRFNGAAFWLCQFALFGLSIATGVSMLKN